MSAETLADKIARRDRYVAAETAILAGAQEYSVEGLRVRRADLPTIQKTIERLNNEIASLEGQQSGNKSAFNKVTFGRPM